jgi:hypothetical protein
LGPHLAGGQCLSQVMLQQLSGGQPKPNCESIINSGYRQAEIVGPLLPEEGLAVFDGYTFDTKVERHRARQCCDTSKDLAE